MRQAETGARAAALDGLRGLAVLVVFFSHAANDGWLPAWLGQGSGQMGVQLFFALSGYLMAHLYGYLPPEPAALRRFAAARAARILPLYLTVLALSALLAWAGAAPHYQVSEPGALAAAALMLTAPQELWSIPVEVQFYAVFALLWAYGAAPRAWVALTAALALGAATKLVVDDLAILPAFLTPFVIGLCLARARLPSWMGAAWVLPLALGVFLLNLPGPRGTLGLEIWSGFYPRLWLDPARFAAIAFLLAAAVAAQRPGLLGGPLIPLGWVSFAVYLFHRPVMRALDGVEGLAGLTLAAGITLVLAAASLRWLERPADRAIRRWAAQPPRPAPRKAAG
ncbi:MAG: acyltransferase [Pseudomonadota bacterium]